MGKIQVELNEQSGYGVVYVVTLDPVNVEGGGFLQDDKMRVYDNEEKARERFNLWKEEAVEYLHQMTEDNEYNIATNTPYLFALSSSDGSMCLNVRIRERILIPKDDMY